MLLYATFSLVLSATALSVAGVGATAPSLAMDMTFNEKYASVQEFMVNTFGSKDYREGLIHELEEFGRLSRKRDLESCVRAANDLVATVSDDTSELFTNCGPSMLDDVAGIFSASEGKLSEIAKGLCENACAVTLRKTFFPIINNCLSVSSNPVLSKFPFMRMVKVLPLVVDMACSTDSTNKYCVTELVNIPSVLQGLDFESGITESSMNTNLNDVCTECFSKLVNYAGSIFESIAGGLPLPVGETFSRMMGLVCARDVDETFCLAKYVGLYEVMDSSVDFDSVLDNLDQEKINVFENLICNSVCFRLGIDALFPKPIVTNQLIVPQILRQNVACTKAPSGETCMKIVLTATRDNYETLSTACQSFRSFSDCSPANSCIQAINTFTSQLGCCSQAASSVARVFGDTCMEWQNKLSRTLCDREEVNAGFEIQFDKANLDLGLLPSETILDAIKQDVSLAYDGIEPSAEITDSNGISVEIFIPDYMVPMKGINFPGKETAGGFSLKSTEPLLAAMCTDEKGTDGCYTTSTTTLETSNSVRFIVSSASALVLFATAFMVTML